MRKMKLFNLAILLFLFGTSLTACTENKANTTIPTNPPTEANPDKDQDDGYIYDGVKTVAPYIVYDQKGTKQEEFDNMWRAIQYAGLNSLSSNKMFVEDGNKKMIFQRQAKNKCYVFDGDYFVGVMNEADAKEWCNNHSRGYVYNGWGQNYVELGKVMYDGSNMDQTIAYEYFSGGYNYMYSKAGKLEGDTWVEQGYGYMETIVRLSEAHYMPSKDGDAWNAYVFINPGAGFTTDLGLIGTLVNNRVEWKMVRNCSHPSHKDTPDDPSFTLIERDRVVTYSDYNEETKDYTGADDLKFQCYAGKDGYKLVITNLTTSEEFVINEYHKDSNIDNTHYLRFLLAASYCPVVGNAWNARSGAYLKDVIFENTRVAHYNDKEQYDEGMMEEFYPGADSFNYGFSQAADCASALFGSFEKNGKYPNGAEYKKGQRYINFSCYYDGSHHNSK